MYQFSKRSLSNLHGVHPHLVLCAKMALEKQIMDFSVISGVRTIKKQKRLVSIGASKTMRSKHLEQNDGYGHAVDLYPYPIDMEEVRNGNWVEVSRFGLLAGIMLSCAKDLGLNIKWGLDWDQDGETLDHNFHDAPHFEILI